jgi:hypothetical protein
MANNRRPIRLSSAAGLSGGTGFAGIALLMPEGFVKSVLLILAPTITVGISSSWHIFTQEVEARVADWRIRNQRRKAEELYRRLLHDSGTTDEIRDKAKKSLEALTLLEVEITKRRVEAIVAS